MAYAYANLGSAATVTTGNQVMTVTPPALGGLMLLACGIPTGSAPVTPTDNGSGNWILVASMNISNTIVGLWYKIARATDVASLTTITFAVTSTTTNGLLWLDQFTGAPGGASLLDTSASGALGTAGTSFSVASASTVPNTSGNELIYSVLGGAANGGGQSVYFAPNGSTPHTTLSLAALGGRMSSAYYWAPPAFIPGTPNTWHWGWTTSNIEAVIGATFTAIQVPSFSVDSRAVARASSF